MSDWQDEAKKQWDSFSGNWSAGSRHMWEEGSRSGIVPFMLEHVPKGRLADLGCGDGYGSMKLASSGYEVTGVDLSPSMIRSAKEKTAGKSGLSFIEGSLTALPFQDGEFDAAMAINSLEWTEEPLEALNEICRVVKPGGFAVIAILGPTAAPRQNSFRRLYGEKVIMNTMQIWEFEKLALSNGWQLAAEKGTNKRGADGGKLEGLPRELLQALSFLWVFILKKAGEAESDGEIPG